MLLALTVTLVLSGSYALPISAPTTSGAIVLQSRAPNDGPSREVITIIYNCIATIIACTYAAIHPNIPPRNAPWWSTLGTRLKITLCALIAPEILILWAMRQRIMAGRIADRYKDKKWTRAHGFFLQMGGFMLRQDNICEVITYDSDKHELKTTSFVGGVGAPRIPEEDINDRNKRDYLSKALVIAQTTWFLVQCLARRIQGLGLTGLELVTLAYAVLNWLTYFLWWDKPHDVGRPMYFNVHGVLVPGPEEGNGEVGASVKALMANPTRKREGFLHTIVEMVLIGTFAAIFKPFWDMIQQEKPSKSGQDVGPFYAAPLEKADRIITIISCGILGIVFGVIHVLGWWFYFPTNIERSLWRSASIAITVVPALVAFVEMLITIFMDKSARRRSGFNVLFPMVVIPVLVISSITYTVARLYLIVQPFVGLRSLEPATFLDIEWNKFVPHIQ
ncbi:hypothetical protein AX16_006699 [Volvariella volvacea WC 439]|nr:hypothetical protein AX16_006699 [Volvariella volvacea WC 439]